MPAQPDRPYFDEFSCFKYIVERHSTQKLSAPFNCARLMNVLQLLEARFTNDRAFLNDAASALAHALIDSERYRFVLGSFDIREGADIVSGGRFLRRMLRDGTVELIDVQRREHRDIANESLPFTSTLDQPEGADIEVFCAVVEAEQPHCVIALASRLLIARGDIRARSVRDQPAFV